MWLHAFHPSAPCGPMTVLILSPPKLLSFPFNLRNKAWQVLDCFTGKDTSRDSYLCHTLASSGQLQIPRFKPWACILAKFPYLISHQWKQLLGLSPRPTHLLALWQEGPGTWASSKDAVLDFWTSPGRAKPKANQAVEVGGSRVKHTGHGSRMNWVESQLCWSPVERLGQAPQFPHL